jgi:hypothetical protein
MKSEHPSWKRMLLVWGLYGPLLNGLVCTLAITAIFATSAALNPRDFSNLMPASAWELGYSLFILLFIIVPLSSCLIAVVAVIPSLVTGLIHRAISARVSNRGSIVTLTCAVGATIVIPYGFFAKSLSFDGEPWLWIPISMLVGALSCLLTLQVYSRTDDSIPAGREPLSESI